MAPKEQRTDVETRERPRRRVTIWNDVHREVKHLEIDYVSRVLWSLMKLRTSLTLL